MGFADDLFLANCIDALKGMVLLAREGWALTGLDPTNLSDEDTEHALRGADWLAENGYNAYAIALRSFCENWQTIGD